MQCTLGTAKRWYNSGAGSRREPPSPSPATHPPTHTRSDNPATRPSPSGWAPCFSSSPQPQSSHSHYTPHTLPLRPPSGCMLCLSSPSRSPPKAQNCNQPTHATNQTAPAPTFNLDAVLLQQPARGLPHRLLQRVVARGALPPPPVQRRQPRPFLILIPPLLCSGTTQVGRVRSGGWAIGHPPPSALGRAAHARRPSRMPWRAAAVTTTALAGAAHAKGRHASRHT